MNDDLKPLISILVFSYNHELYIEQAIKSVVSQKTSFNFEVLVSDDFSTDNSLNIICELQRENSEIIKVIANKKNLGLNVTFKNAVKKAKGEYIAILGGDDYWLVDNKLEIQVQLLLSNKKVAYVHTEFKTLTEENGKITNQVNKNWRSILTGKKGKEALIATLLNSWSGYPLSSSSCFRKAPLLKGIKNHPDILNFDLPGEGTIIHASMSYYGGLYAFIPIETTMYRVRKKSLSYFENKYDTFNFQKKYYLVKVLTAISFSLDIKEIEKIRDWGLKLLLIKAYDIGTINEFKEFLQSYKKGGSLIKIIYLFKISFFRKIYKFLIKLKQLYDIR